MGVPLLGAIIHLFVSKKPRSLNRITELLLLWYLGVGIGVGSLFSGLVQVISPEIVAQSTGWGYSPFLREVGFANISYGILGLLAVRFRNFWAPAIIAYAVFMWGAAAGHIYEIQQNVNLSVGNAGTVLYLDILMPLFLIILLLVYQKTLKKDSSS
ncbi:putative membrane protein [Methanobacterium formicicum]|nr:putative membrane protein [Methanobacterium formicicum]